jgi:hypothetical protein
MIKKYSDILVLGILWIISIHGLIVSFTDNYLIGISNYIGYGLLILTTILRLINLPKLKLILALLLFLATIQVIQFSYYTIGFFIKINPSEGDAFGLGLQPIHLILLLLFIFANFAETAGLIFNSPNDDKSLLIQRYYNELNHISDFELDEISKNLLSEKEEKIIAAKILLRERKS